MAKSIDLEIDQGTNFTAILPVTNTDGSVFNLTGYTANCAASRSYSSNPLYAVQVPAAVSNATGGLITLTMSAVATAALVPGRYIYDIEIIDGSGNVTRVFDGLITVNLSVVRT